MSAASDFLERVGARVDDNEFLKELAAVSVMSGSMSIEQAKIIGMEIGKAIENEMTHGAFAEKIGAGIAKGLLPWASHTTQQELFAEILGKAIGEAMKNG